MSKIINFHKVIDIKWFNEVICLLKSKYEMINIETLQEYFAGTKKINKSFCHITVDDGNRTFYEIIFPILKKHNVPASIFVSPKICKEGCNFWFQEIQGYDPIELKRTTADMLNIPFSFLDNYPPNSILKNLQIHQIQEILKRYQKKTNTPVKPSQNMTIKHLIEIEKSGLVAIGAHTLNHPILANENAENSNYEITESINMLSTLLGHKIDFFAYPNGLEKIDFTERETNYLRNMRIQLAFSTEPRNFSFSDSPMSIPRFGITYGNMHFIKTKLILGPLWNTIKKFRLNEEARERVKLIQIINNLQNPK